MVVDRRGKQGKQQDTEKSEGDFDFALSQQSNESDELQRQTFLEQIERECVAQLEKKKAQKEKKFLGVAAKRLKDEVDSSSKEVQSAVKAIEDIYATFLTDYAACEDNIHAKWTQIQKERENLKKLVEERYPLDENKLKAAVASQIIGMNKIKTACMDYRAIIEEHIFPGTE